MKSVNILKTLGKLFCSLGFLKDYAKEIKRLNTSFDNDWNNKDDVVKEFCKYLTKENEKYNSDQVFLLITGILKLYKGDDINPSFGHKEKNQIEKINIDVNLTDDVPINTSKTFSNSNRNNESNQVHLRKIKYKKTSSEIRDKNNNGIVNKLKDEQKLHKSPSPQYRIKKIIPEFNTNNFYFTTKTIKKACSQFFSFHTNRSNYKIKLKNEKKQIIQLEREANFERNQSKDNSRNILSRRRQAAENYRERCYEVCIYS